MVKVQLNIGADAVAINADQLDGDSFGARYDSYRNFDRFSQQTDELNLGLIVWPGGDLAETRDDRYGLEHDGLYADWTGKPDIDAMMASAVASNATLAIVIPTVRYLGREAELQVELDNFLADLLGGVYGPLPSQMILEVGSEYYAHFTDGATSGASQYGALADQIVSQIVTALEDPAINLVSGNLTVAVQSGKTLADDADIRAELSPASMSEIDMIIHHRFSPQAQGFDARMDVLEEIMLNWRTDSLSAGGEDPELFVSAWNVASFTRQNALDEYLEANPELTAADVDLEGRTTDDFERFYQTRLTDFDYGKAHPGAIVEAFASYAEVGMDAGAIFGSDFLHAGRLSWREGGMDHEFAGNEMIQMLYEAVGGTKALASEGDYSRANPFHTYAFEGEDRLVVFIAAGETPPETIELGIERMSNEFISVWADTLTTRVDENWMSVFNIPDNPNVDESAEAETYAYGVRGGKEFSYSDDTLGLTMSSHEVIRLVFARTEEAADEINLISDGAEFDLTAYAHDESAVPTVPVVDTPESGYGYPEEGDVDGSGGGGGGMAGILGLLPLFFFFF